MAPATAPKPSLLVVDDDPKLREVVRYALERAGYLVCEAGDGLEALERIASHPPFALMVVDVSMPELDGLEFLRRLRVDDPHTPLLFLSARGDEIDRILGLELGADDYLTKPFSTRELVTRVKVLLRRIERARSPGPAAEIPELRAGGLRLIPDTHRAWCGERELTLTATEFRLLEVLMRRAGRVYSREELGELAYPDARHVSGRTLDSHIRRIRAKCREHGLDPVETVHGVGYRLHQP